MTGVAVAGMVVPRGIAFVLYALVAELLATYLIHCPAHYFVGRALGIRFVGMKVGRTTLARALPARYAKLARLLPIITLTTDRPSLAEAGKDRAAAMYVSGTVASVLSAFAVAGLLIPGGSVPLIVVTWSVALGYLAFDLVFSPRSGDLRRARVARSA